MNLRSLVFLVCGMVIASPGSAQERAALYRPTVLLTVDTAWNSAGLINNVGGYTLGFKSDSPYPGRESFYSGGEWFALGSFRAINDHGVGVGSDFAPDPNQPPGPPEYLYFGAYTEGGTIKAFVPGYTPVALNNSGMVVGTASGGSGAQGSILFDIGTGAYTAIPALNGSIPYASDINEGGQVVGTARNPDGSTQAFIFRNGEITALPFGGTNSQAFGINASGQILGRYTDGDGSNHTIMYSDGVVTDLTAMIGYDAKYGAPPFNDLGQILFYQGNVPTIYIDGIAYPIQMVDNDPSRSSFYQVSSLNDNGQLLAITCEQPWGGYGCTVVRLDFVATIPEPPVWAMLAVGLVLAGTQTRVVKRRG